MATETEWILLNSRETYEYDKMVPEQYFTDTYPGATIDISALAGEYLTRRAMLYIDRNKEVDVSLTFFFPIPIGTKYNSPANVEAFVGSNFTTSFGSGISELTERTIDHDKTAKPGCISVTESWVVTSDVLEFKVGGVWRKWSETAEIEIPDTPVEGA